MTFRKPGEFLSTPSARRATRLRLSEYETFIFLSTPSARRETCADQHRFDHKGISIHALREEGDLLLLQRRFHAVKISIHALREEGDNLTAYALEQVENFYPRPPRGGRRGGANADKFMRENFYPRPPRGGRPFPVSNSESRAFISIHALREEGDHREKGRKRYMGAFLSTPSARRATAKTERKHPAFVSLYTSLHKLQRDACKPNRKITPLLAQTAGIPVRSVPENYVCCRFALAGHQKISTLSWANSGCSPTCSTLVW